MNKKHRNEIVAKMRLCLGVPETESSHEIKNAFKVTLKKFRIKLTSCSKNLSSNVFSPGLFPAPSNKALYSYKTKFCG